MTTPFIHDDWLLPSPLARRLYHDYAAGQPILDYHNHLSPKFVAHNHRFANLHEAWLAGDHYKWRAMRVHGIAETLITGKAAPQEKFAAFAKTVPFTARNPLFHWSHLELARYFGITELLTGDNAARIYEQASEHLQQDSHRAVGLLRQQGVKLICTTDDPTDSLEHHQAYARSAGARADPSTSAGLDRDTTGREAGPKMLPTFRPDKALVADTPGWRAYLDRLATASGVDIVDYESLLAAIEARMDHFAALGCALSDHGLGFIPAASYNAKVADRLLRARDEAPTTDDAATFLFTLLVDLGRRYARRGWVMQLHLGAQRNNNRRALRELGPDTGYDSIGDYRQAEGLAALLNTLNDTDELPRVILYNLNPADNHVFATMAGNYCGGGTVAKVQWGAAWWFLDQWDGMREQLNTLSSVGLLAHFVGMLTDSRSFLSFPRHEYFRRLLCTLLAQDVADGKLPADEPWLGSLVEDICYRNAKRWFGFA